MRGLASGASALGLAALAVLLTAPPVFAAGGTITTAAGTGVAGYSGDGGQATSAQLSTPAGVAVDGQGNIYIADDGADVVRKILPSGTISTVAGTGIAGYSGDGGAATAAKLNQPTDVVLDAAGNLYVADFGNHVVRQVDASGNIHTVAGTGAIGYSGDGGNATAAKLTSPAGLDVDTAGNVYIADYGNGTVRKLTTNGKITTIAGTGVPGYSGDSGPATSAQLDHPGDVATDGSTVYVADAYNVRVREIAPGGTITTVAGNGTAAYTGDGGAATSASLMFPTGLALDSAGNLFISDYSAGVVREVAAADGTISTVAGDGTAGYSGDGGAATSAQLNGPVRVNLDAGGDLYISEWNNHVMRQVSALGAPATAPDAPSGVTATAGDAAADVSWTAPANDGGSAITGYDVIPNDGNADLTPIPVGAGQTATTVTGLANGSAYTFTVTATNAAGTSAASAASAPVTPSAPAPPPPTPTAPDAPTGVSATAGDTTADVSWTAPANDGGSAITGYDVIPNDGTADLTPIPVGAGQTATTVTGLTNDTAYTFTVTATNTAGTSAPSAASAPVTPTAPPPPPPGGSGPPAPGPNPTASPPTQVDPPTDTPTPPPPSPPVSQPTPRTQTPQHKPDHSTTNSEPAAAPQAPSPPDPPATSPLVSSPAVAAPLPTAVDTPPHHHRRHFTPPTLRGHQLAHALGRSPAIVPAPSRRVPVVHSSHWARVDWPAISAAVVTASKKTAVPAGLLLLIAVFLTIQNRLDRRDPKLALAPVYADPGVSFVPAMS